MINPLAIFIFLLILSLVIGFVFWHYLPIFVVLANGMYVFTAYIMQLQGGISVILFIFNIPSFAVIGVYDSVLNLL